MSNVSVIIWLTKVDDSGFHVSLLWASEAREVIEPYLGSELWPDAHSAYKAALTEVERQQLDVEHVEPKLGFPLNYQPPLAISAELRIVQDDDKVFARLISLDYDCEDWHYFNHVVKDEHGNKSMLNRKQATEIALKVAKAHNLTVQRIMNC